MAENKVYVSEVQREIKELKELSEHLDKLVDALIILRDSKDKEKSEIFKDLNVASECDVISALCKIKTKLKVISGCLETNIGNSQINAPGYIW